MDELEEEPGVDDDGDGRLSIRSAGWNAAGGGNAWPVEDADTIVGIGAGTLAFLHSVE